MKKFTALLLSLMLLAGLVPCAGCAEAATVKVVTTIFPIYDWVRQIAGASGRVAPVNTRSTPQIPRRDSGRDPRWRSRP